MNSKALKIYNLPRNREVQCRLDAKPTASLWLLATVGCIICFKSTTIYFGIFCILSAFYGLLFLPRRVLLEFCKDYVIVYNRVNHDDCQLVYYDEIICWQYVKGVPTDKLILELEGGESVSVRAFAKGRTVSYIRAYCPNREKK